MSATVNFKRVISLLWIVFFFYLPVNASEMSALDVMTRMDNRESGQDSVSNMTMTLIDRRGNKRVRKLKAYRKKYDDVTKSINFFISPADVRNTAFLAFDWKDEGKEDDNWLYLPALRKVKRISGGNKKDAFMGSDFSYSDINGQDISLWDFKFLKRSDVVDGHDCWVIEALPKPTEKERVIDETGYEKNISWVRKDLYMTVKGIMYVRKGRQIKYFTATDIENIQGIWTAKKLTMITTKRKKTEHSTIIQFDDMLFNQGVNDNLFTTQRMERGL